MGTSAFQSGAEFVIDGVEHILTRKVTDTLWQLEEKRTRRIKEMTDEDLQRLYVAGTLLFVTEPILKRKPDVAGGKKFLDISREEFANAKVRRSYVEVVLDLPSTAAVILPAIHDLWLRLKKPERRPGTRSVLRWKQKYIAAGRDIRSVVHRHQDKGNQNERFCKKVLELVDDAINAVYMTLERRSVQETLDRAESLVDRENKLRPRELWLKRPTRRLIKRLLAEISAFDKYAARHGHTKAMNKFRAVLGHRVSGFPLERAEIDHTIIDVMVVDDKTFLPLGRPFITVCIDDFTRCILGIYISFEPPSYFTVARCLKDCFLPKVRLKELYPDVQHPWVAHGVMRELVVDNGAEFHSESLEQACLTLGIEIHYAPRKTGWFKGKIERFLGVLNHSVSQGIPGTTFSNVLEKEDYDPSAHAVIRLAALQRIIRIWIADYYHQKPHRALQVSPAVMWESNIKPEDIPLPDDLDQLDAILGRVDTRVLSHKGIELDSLFYNSPSLSELRRRHGDRLEVEIRIDDADLGKIFVLSPDKKQIFEAACLSPAYAKGLSRWQHKVCRRYASKTSDKSGPKAWLDAKMAIAQIIRDELANKPRKSAKKMARYQAAGGVDVDAADALTPTLPEPQAIVSTETPTTTAIPPRTTSTRHFEPVLRDRSVSAFDHDTHQENVHV